MFICLPTLNTYDPSYSFFFCRIEIHFLILGVHYFPLLLHPTGLFPSLSPHFFPLPQNMCPPQPQFLHSSHKSQANTNILRKRVESRAEGRVARISTVPLFIASLADTLLPHPHPHPPSLSHLCNFAIHPSRFCARVRKRKEKKPDYAHSFAIYETCSCVERIDGRDGTGRGAVGTETGNVCLSE